MNLSQEKVEEVVKIVKEKCGKLWCSSCVHLKKPRSECQTRMVLDILSQMQPKPQLPVVETGVLKSPAEITGCKDVDAVRWIDKDGDRRDYILNAYDYCMRRNLNEFPREFYKDIETEIDYSKIPVGSKIEIEFENNNAIAYLQGVKDDHLLLSHWGKSVSFDFMLLLSGIKSIKILQLPKGK